MLASVGENREYSLEIRYIRKVLTDANKHIILPDSLKGSLLRSKLDGVKAPERGGHMRFMFPKGWFTLSSGVTYAAAFLLIVGLFYGMGFNKRQDIVTGELPLSGMSGAGESRGDSPASALPEPVTAGIPEPDSVSAYDIPAERAGTAGEAPARLSSGISSPASAAPAWGVGGGGKATRLATYESYALVCRPNDQTDPDRLPDSLLVLELLDEGGDRIVSQISLPSMTEINECLVFEDSVALVGSDGSAVFTYAIDLSDPENPRGLNLLEQPGKLKGAHSYKDVLHVFSYSEGIQDFEGGELIPLPGSALEGACVVTALDIGQASFNQAAFLGAGEDIKIYNLNAYIYYDYAAEDGSSAAAEENDFHIAQIRLNGLDIELGGVSKK